MIKKFFKLFFTFSGRINRARFLGYELIIFILIFLTAFTFRIGEITETIIVQEISGIVLLILAISNMSFAFRRLHDVDISGWFYLVLLIPVLGLICYILLFIVKGNYYENKYGLNPINSH